MAISFWLLAIAFFCLLPVAYCLKIVFLPFVSKHAIMEVTRLFDMLERDLKEFPKEDALCCKENGIWVKYSTAKYVEIVNNLSYGLLQLGIKKGDSVATITPNRPEWNFLDMAIMQVGAVHVAIRPSARAITVIFSMTPICSASLWPVGICCAKSRRFWTINPN